MPFQVEGRRAMKCFGEMLQMQSETFLKVVCFTFMLSALSGCSSVGPGLANHPGDCALGIPWADCLPGTAGYANGGGGMHKENAQKQNDNIANQFKASTEQCKATMAAASELDPIRRKVELVKESPEAAPAFETAANDEFPRAAEKPAIAKWATFREECVKRSDAISAIPPDANALTANYIRQDRAFMTELSARVADLIVSLYQQKITYGEFAKKRYEIGKAAMAAQREFRQSSLIDDQQRKMQAQQSAQQQFQNNLTAWSNYMQSVNARQPQTVRMNTNIHCSTINGGGGFSTTDCY